MPLKFPHPALVLNLKALSLAAAAGEDLPTAKQQRVLELKHKRTQLVEVLDEAIESGAPAALFN